MSTNTEKLQCRNCRWYEKVLIKQDGPDTWHNIMCFIEPQAINILERPLADPTDKNSRLACSRYYRGQS